MSDQTTRGKITRDSQGRNQNTIDDAVNDADAARLKAMGLSYRQVAAEQGVSVGTAFQRVKRALAVVPVAAAEHLRAVDNEMLDMVQSEMMIIMRSSHQLVSHGRLIPGQLDVRPKVMAANTLIRVQARRSALNGYEAPVKHEVRVNDRITEEIERLALELGIAADAPPAVVAELETIAGQIDSGV